MNSSAVVPGRILLAAVLTAGGVFAAPKLATVATGTSTAASVAPKKMDARQVDELVQQGTAALAAGDSKLARDLFLDAVQADSRHARGLHGLALAYYALNDLPKAAAAIDRAVAVPGALDHSMTVNAGAIHFAAKSPMRAAKIAKDYLTAKPNPVNEPVANIILIALDKADAQARRNAFYGDVKSFYTAYVKRMETANPGYMRFGAQWLPADKVLEYNRVNATQQPVVDRTTKELTDLESTLTVRREQLVAITQKIERGYAERWADNEIKDDIRNLEQKRDEKKRVLDETSAKMVKSAPLPELTTTVAMDSTIPALSKPVEIAVAPPVQPQPPVVVTEPQPANTDGPTTRRSRRFRRPPGDEGPVEQPGQPPMNDPRPANPVPPAMPAQPVNPPAPPAEVPPAVAENPAPPPVAPKKIKLTTYAAAFSVSPDLLVTTAAAVEGSIKISLQSPNGDVVGGELVRVDPATGLALVRVIGVKLHYLDLGTPQAGKVTCAAFADANIFAPTAELLAGTAPAPMAAWPIRFTRHPRLAGAPLLQNSKVVGVATGDRDSDMASYPAVPVEAIKAILGEDAPKAPGNLSEPLLALFQVSATKEREQ
jgi:tetratricopeptide (TPR) repeat protein